MKDTFTAKHLESMIKKYNCDYPYPSPNYLNDYDKSRSIGQKKLKFYAGKNKRKVPITLAKLSFDK